MHTESEELADITEQPTDTRGGIPVHLVVFAGILLIANVIYFSVTNPVTGGPIVVLGALFLLFWLLYAVMRIATSFFARLFGIPGHTTKLILISGMLAIDAVIMLGLRSLQQLGIADITLLSATTVLLSFYIFRRF